MDFPVFGDADGYVGLGKNCADFIMSEGVASSSCYDSIRPVGIAVYYAIPFLLTNDPVEQNYITVLLNVACLFVLVASLLVLFRNLSGAASTQKTLANYIGEATIVASTLVLCVAYIPVRLSDIQGFAFFVASLAIISDENGRKNVGALITAGVLAGFSVLMKQNYVASIFFLVLFWFCFDFKNQIQSKFKYVFLYLVGVSICLIQVVLVYHKTGTFWFYDLKAMEYFAPTNAQPYIELVAYTDPAKNAYVSQLQTELSALQFTAVKFYEGMTKFYWSVYLGRAPLDVTPIAITIEGAKLFYMQLILFIVALVTLATSFFKNKWISVISLMTISSSFLTAAILHTENRYYLMTKVFFILILAVVLVKVVKNGIKKVNN